jgi:tryptophan 2,3-dioxygenase
MMDPKDDANWWLFSIDPKERGERITAADGVAREMNPPTPDGRHLLDYHSYIGLDRLLACQMPSSLVPDERAFIITHQLFELTFKMMIFDLAVVAATLSRLLEEDEGSFRSLCTGGEERFWLSALTASGRLVHSARTLLPASIGYLGEDETFSSREFRSFRPNLHPASGFQSAQFRLIQRALGKGNLLSVRLFPAEEYWKQYGAAENRGPASVVDPIILRGDEQTAAPPAGSPLHLAAMADDLSHRVLTRLAPTGEEGTGVPAISSREMEEALKSFRRLLSAQRDQQEVAGQKPADAQEKDRMAEEIFRGDLESAVERENLRRELLGSARAGALHLRTLAPGGYLARVLDRLAATDAALHGPQQNSFLSIHLRLTARRIKDLNDYAREEGKPDPPRGTGGGGIPYLAHVKSYLLPLFPALVAWLDGEERVSIGMELRPIIGVHRGQC